MVRRIEWAVRAAVYSDLVRGVPAQEIAPVRGVATGSVKRWAILAGLKFAASRSGGGVVQVPVDAAPPGGEHLGYRRLTLADRSFIQAARTLDPPMPVREIARQLQADVSTVSPEIARQARADASRWAAWGDVASRPAHDRPR